MAALSEVYVDPSIDANSGAGTAGDPYGDLQYALNTMTFNSTNGSRVRINRGTTENLTGVLSIPFSPNGVNACVFEPYGTGNMPYINGGAGNFSIYNGAKSAIYFNSLKMGNCGSATAITIGLYGGIENCEVHDASAGISATAVTSVVGSCFVHDIDGGIGIDAFHVTNCYCKQGASNKFSSAINLRDIAANNIVSVDGASNGINVSVYYGRAVNNTILSSAGTGVGITAINDLHAYGARTARNLVEGFSGAGGIGIRVGTNQDAAIVTHNAMFNNTTNLSQFDQIRIAADNEILGSSLFSKTGSEPTDFNSATFWADLYTYFAPSDIGSIFAFQKGAVWGASANSGSSRRHAPFSGGISG